MGDEKVPRLSGVEMLVLSMLIAHRGEMYGLQMVEASEGKLKRGTIYVTLGRMEEKGFIESRPEEQLPGASGLPRRLYKPTGHGARVLRAWEVAEAVLAGAVA